jgi:hypothetical protein
MRINGGRHGDASVEEKTLAAFYCGIELILTAGLSSGWFRKLYHQTPAAWMLTDRLLQLQIMTPHKAR